MMKNILFLISISIFSINSFAQVGIGTNTPHSSAILEVSTAQKSGGILLPNVPLKGAYDNITVPNPARGLMVYNTSNAGNSASNDLVYANEIYLWNGTRWNNISDMEVAKDILLPPVFYAQSSEQQLFVDSELTALNNGNGALVEFNPSNVIINNGNHIEMSNNEFIIKTPGQYEISAFINYSPRSGNSTKTNLEFRIQRSNDNGSSWFTVASTREVWGLYLGNYYRSVIMPPSVVEGLNTNDRLRLVIARADNYGVEHGTGSVEPVSISVGQGITFSKNIKFLKLN